MSTAFLAAFDRLPAGTFTGRAGGRRYIVSRSDHVGGKAAGLVAEALDGSDHVGMNLYRTAAGARLRPCEMPAEKVVAFVLALRPDPDQ